MQPRRQDALAGPGLALQQHWTLASRYFGRGFGQTLDNRTLSKEGIEHDAPAARVIGKLFLLIARILQHLVDDQQERG